jgi:hypothetical protein
MFKKHKLNHFLFDRDYPFHLSSCVDKNQQNRQNYTIISTLKIITLGLL